MARPRISAPKRRRKALSAPDRVGDADLVDDAVRREMLAFLPRLRRFAYGLTGSLDEADDLLQTTCEQAIRHLDQWQAGTRLDSWMYRIARNLHLNAVRARGVRSRHLQAVAHQSAAVDGARIVEARLSFDALRRFVDQLPEEQRAVLLLVTVEGLSYKEAAELLELPVGTVTSRLGRARRTLLTLMDQGADLDEEPGEG